MRDAEAHREARRQRYASGDRQPSETAEGNAARSRRWRASLTGEQREAYLAKLREYGRRHREKVREQQGGQP